MPFVVEEFVTAFVAEPSFAKIESLKKSDLLQLSKRFGLTNCKTAMRKAQILRAVTEHLVDENVFDQSVLENIPEYVDQGSEIEKLKIQLQFEQEKRDKEIEFEIQRQRLEFDKSVRERELQLEELRLREGAYVRDTVPRFDIARHVKMVPSFNEKDPANYFQCFERVARTAEWPRDKWTLLLQSVLCGKAQTVYAALGDDDALDYDVVKLAILKAYELVPEAYRQKFRAWHKRENQNFVEFAQDQVILFDKWCSAQEVKEDYEKLRQLMLIEQFKNTLSTAIRTYLDEREPDTIQEAAVYADQYFLTHKRFQDNSRGVQGIDKGSQDKVKSGPVEKSVNSEGGFERKSAPVCAYCKKRGHLISDCWFLKKKNQSQSGGSGKPVALTNSQMERSELIEEGRKAFCVEGLVGCHEKGYLQSVQIWRDTGAFQSLMQKDVVPATDETSLGVSIPVQGVGGYVGAPLHRVHLKCDIFTGPAVVGIVNELPIPGVQLLLGNDLVGAKVGCLPLMVGEPIISETSSQNDDSLLPACAVTRSMSKAQKEMDSESDEFDLAETFMNWNDSETSDVELVASKSSLVRAQSSDPALSHCRDEAVSDEECQDLSACFYWKSGVLMRKWMPPEASLDEEWLAVHQVVVPTKYRGEILNLAHENPMGGHLGVRKTKVKILQHFYWPGLQHDVADHCRTCHTCQVVGKPNQSIPKAPLKPIPAFEEPFSRVIIDCVGPLPRTSSGFKYLLTIMCASTRFPEAVPLRNIKAPTISKALVKFFTLFGLPKTVQSDQGSNFMSGVFQQVMHELQISQVRSSAYHPESQGALERFHQTLKTMLRSYCLDHQKDWDEGVPVVLFAARESVQESLGFSPFEMVFGHSVRGPLKILKEKFLGGEPTVPLLDYVSAFKERFHSTCEKAHENLRQAQANMKHYYDRNASVREFEVGDKVLVLLPIPNDALHAKFFGPYIVEQKLGELDYVIRTPDRRKQKRVCHVNLLKRYYDRDSPSVALAVPTEVSNEPELEGETSTPVSDSLEFCGLDVTAKLRNSEVLAKLDSKLDHLTGVQRKDIEVLFEEYRDLFSDVPQQTDAVEHDVQLLNDDVKPVKQPPYRVSPVKLSLLREEVSYMLEGGLIEPSESPWSSPCILVPKKDGGWRFCTDFRKVNTLTASDSFPLPRIEDCVDSIGQAKFVTKLDLLKGYWQVPLTDRAKLISAFVTPEGSWQYKVMPFGMKNAPSTFQRLMNKVINGLEGCRVYLDDLVIFADSWSQHLDRLHALFARLRQAKLTINLIKSEIGQAQVVYLGYVVGQGHLRPINAKVQAIVDFPPPTSPKEVRRFLGMVGYYRKFCQNFAEVALPLTNLTSKQTPFIWTGECQESFNSIKAMMSCNPILATPNFTKPFKIASDASDLGAGAILLQSDSNDVEHPVAYFSKKFDKHQRRYSVVEKEALAMLLALQHFDIYVNSGFPTTIYTDHNPLTFVHKMRNKNQRLLRWSLALQEYDLVIKHIRGKDNVIADGLSRA
jgi:hypothetical protein